MNSNQIDARATRCRHARRLPGVVVWMFWCLLAAAEARGGVLVQMDFGSFGTVNVDLFDNVAPQSVNNFLQYVNAGRYANTIIHRAVDANNVGIGVIQGGGYDADFQHISTFSPIPLEYHLDNARGTLAMARTANPNSATSEWYFNTVDNSSLLGPGNGGGYAVFGWVVGAAMGTLENIDALPTFVRPPHQNVPLHDYTQTDYSNGVEITSHLVVLNGMTVVSTHPSFQNPIWQAT